MLTLAACGSLNVAPTARIVAGYDWAGLEAVEVAGGSLGLRMDRDDEAFAAQR